MLHEHLQTEQVEIGIVLIVLPYALFQLAHPLGVEEVPPLRSYTPHRIPDVRLFRIRLFAKRIVHIIIRIC